MPSRSPFQAVSIVASSGVPAPGSSSPTLSAGAVAGCVAAALCGGTAAVCGGGELCGGAAPVDGADWPHAIPIIAVRVIAVRSVGLVIVVEVSSWRYLPGAAT